MEHAIRACYLGPEATSEGRGKTNQIDAHQKRCRLTNRGGETYTTSLLLLYVITTHTYILFRCCFYFGVHGTRVKLAPIKNGSTRSHERFERRAMSTGSSNRT